MKSAVKQKPAHGARRVKGALHTRTSIVRKQDKKVLHEDDETEETDEVEIPDGAGIAVIHYVIPIKLSMGFNSAGVEVGVEMPWPVRPGHLEDLNTGFKRTATWVESRLERKAKEVPGLLRALAKKERR